MEFGPWFDFRNPPGSGVSFPRLYAEVLEQIEAAEQLGFDRVWLSEHHFVDDGYSPSLLPIAAAIAMRTRRIRIGTAVLLLPLHNALRVAEDAATVDILSDGRFELGVANGYRPAEFHGFGVPSAHRASLLEEGIEVIRRAWTDDGWSFHGRHYHLDQVAMAPKPVQQPHPPLWLGAHTPAAIRRAARLGLGLLAEGTERLRLYAEERARQGRNPGGYRTGLVIRTLYVCDDPAQGWNEIKPHVLYRQDGYARFRAEQMDAPHRLDPSYRPLQDADALRPGCIVGTPEQVIEALGALQREFPFDDVVFWATLPGMDLRRSFRSLELLATRVLPHIRTPSSPRRYERDARDLHSTGRPGP